MTRHALAAWRNLAAWLSTACLFLMLAGLIDGSQAGGRKDPNLSELLPGQSLNISGPMPKGAETLEQLRITSSQPELAVRLQETYSGFWLGGQLWRAEVTASPALAPGDHLVTLSSRTGTSPKHAQTFTLRAYPDRQAQDRASLSLLKRSTGASPFVLATLLLPLGIVFGVASTLLSRRLAALLRAEGLGQVVRVQKTGDGLLASFTLGSHDGLAQGCCVEFLGPDAKTVLLTASVSAVRAGDTDVPLPAGTKPPLSALVRKSG